jgi:hypothetical protein
MSMMGSSPGVPGISFEEVINLLKDEPAYQAKLREMQKRTEEARSTMAQAVAINGKTEEAKGVSTALAKQAEQQVIEARVLKEAAEKQAAAALAHEAALQTQHQAWQEEANAMLHKGQQQLRDAFIAREKEVATKEQQLLADIKQFEAEKAEERARIEAFDAFKRGKEAELAGKDAKLKDELAEADLLKAQNLESRRELQDKLNKIKSITAG